METAKACGVAAPSMRQRMEEAYKELSSLLGVQGEGQAGSAALLIKEALAGFTDSCERPALWCCGEHTRRLMADYIFEMKKVRYIIDEHGAGAGGGFQVITKEKIEQEYIDGIIISTYKYREEITGIIRACFPGIKYLDLYQMLHEQGIDLNCEYYATEYPCARYARINRLKRELCREQRGAEHRSVLYESLAGEFAAMKDFRSAASVMEKYIAERDSGRNREILHRLHEIYGMELQAASKTARRNVLMLCIDGLRRQDLFSEDMKKVENALERRGYFFTNAYSASTSTYESLIPAYSGNNDLSTKYYEKSELSEEECPFVSEAVGEGRNIYFYTDCCHYVRGSHVKVTNRYQTASEKLWDFFLDAAEEENGLFYVHVLYESHYSYPNPYTAGELVTEGTSILFDFLPRNGGRMRTDYEGQHRDALRYLDDLLAPFLERLPCSMVVYADHGNILLGKEAVLEEVAYPQLTFGRELIQVPLVVCSDETGRGRSGRICSIMELNSILICLLRQEAVAEQESAFVKVVRSRLYNVDFHYLYQKRGCDRGLEAFEAFVFQEGYKLVVYEDKNMELYLSETDERIEDRVLEERLLEQVRDGVTVWA